MAPICIPIYYYDWGSSAANPINCNYHTLITFKLHYYMAILFTSSHAKESVQTTSTCLRSPCPYLGDTPQPPVGEGSCKFEAAANHWKFHSPTATHPSKHIIWVEGLEMDGLEKGSWLLVGPYLKLWSSQNPLGIPQQKQEKQLSSMAFEGSPTWVSVSIVHSNYCQFFNIFLYIFTQNCCSSSPSCCSSTSCAFKALTSNCSCRANVVSLSKKRSGTHTE